MALGYRTVFAVRSRRDQVIPIVRGQLYAWLRWKRLDADLAEVGQRAQLKPNVALTLQELSGGDESSTFRARLEEAKSGGTWRSTVTAHVPGDTFRDPWVWIDIEAPDGKPWTGRPKIAEYLLDVVDAYDGATSLSAVPEIVRPEDVEKLVALLQDPARRRLIFVAGSDEGMPIPRWTSLLKDLLRETVGLASTYVLDASATTLMTTQLGERMAVAPGTVRTYAPRLDIDDPDDAIRHRILGTRRILQANPQSIARTLGEQARILVTAQPLPRAVVRVDHLLERQLDDLLLGVPAATAPTAVEIRALPTPDSEVEVLEEAASLEALDEIQHAEALTQAAFPSSEATADNGVASGLGLEADAFLALRESLRDLLGLGEPTSAAVVQLTALARLGQDSVRRAAEVSQRLADVRQQLVDVEEQRSELARRHEDELVEHAVTASALRRSEAAVRHLRDLFLRQAPDADIWTPPDEDLVPEDFHQLVELAGVLDGVDVKGVDPAVAYSLDAHESLGVWAGKTWDILLALSDYTRAKSLGQCNRDVDGYLRNTPTGYRTYSANRHARDESEDVQRTPAFRDRRVFRVPEAVASDGKVFMGAHFKIAQYGLISPRLHYHDATSVDGRIYVGYIGPHLPTKQTN